MAFLKKKKPVEVDVEYPAESNGSKPSTKKEQEQPTEEQPVKVAHVPIEFVIAEQMGVLEEKVQSLNEKVDELLKIAKE